MDDVEDPEVELYALSWITLGNKLGKEFISDFRENIGQNKVHMRKDEY